jgi:hypothetical protein
MEIQAPPFIPAYRLSWGGSEPQRVSDYKVAALTALMRISTGHRDGGSASDN